MDRWRVRAAGDAAVLVELGREEDPAVNRGVHRLAAALRGLPGILETVPGYTTLLVVFDPRRWDGAGVAALVEAARPGPAPPFPGGRRVRIPVCYGGEWGPDLEAVAARHHLTPQTVVTLHAGRDYPVYALGFSPGFPMLGGLDPRLATPRLDTPRLKVPAGSVGIGGRQTGIYPLATPGGWNLIGRTPLRLFRPDRVPPVPYRPGDVLHFDPIDADAFARLAGSPAEPAVEVLEPEAPA
ncbi:L-5-oxoprolinase (ATP-dependent) subunit B [Candidatus Hydrogenisulfobacillus filiaventi]|uniref:L-5-oxoprolinase (ATP-dependent) subunit B n=1 Tax=Candidatus Hydrogenisulfobacillus filiaventi TaxID=2707344 RepID=A0A6F8ZHD4_9FIRM|nr:L-5-oxoprolinase (ATP-dependent) subunit B [Candidatus Hydrogenisulfobacillus filiaventi]